jgi:hypothetical protein
MVCDVAARTQSLGPERRRHLDLDCAGVSVSTDFGHAGIEAADDRSHGTMDAYRLAAMIRALEKGSPSVATLDHTISKRRAVFSVLVTNLQFLRENHEGRKSITLCRGW